MLFMLNTYYIIIISKIKYNVEIMIMDIRITFNIYINKNII